MSGEIHESLRQAAEAATPGPWAQGMVGDRLINEVDCAAAFGFIKVDPRLTDDGVGGIADATFIALANPASVLSLLARLARVEELAQKWEDVQGLNADALLWHHHLAADLRAAIAAHRTEETP